MDILNTIQKPYKIFADVNLLDFGAIEQFVDAMKQDFVVRGALMPDAHKGYSLPIGGVVETKGYVVPSYVGFDIGCGMCAVETTFNYDDIQANKQNIYDGIRKAIPVGFNKRDRVSRFASLDISKCTDSMRRIFDDKNGYRQLGTLGGGNHFIEIGMDENSKIWIIVHSGSRGVGHGCATHYMKKASPTGKASEGHFGFDTESQDGKDYIKDLNWCLDFALMNRMIMVYDIISVIKDCGVDGDGDMLSAINRNHNHAESADGIHWIHRKGATHAEKGMRGVIPGNMKDGSFIVTGLGNEDSLNSSSHGAGRVLGRKKAKETLDIDEFEKCMYGVLANVDISTLDESPMAYKNIFDVMDYQKELVDVDNYVIPLINVKG